MFAILGEALIDMVIKDNGKTLDAHFGGGPFNTALALARLGEKTHFHFPLSTDFYGRGFKQLMLDNNIHYSCPYLSDDATPLAMVHVDDEGKAEYRFYRHNTAERDLRQDSLLSSLPKDLFAIHTGTLAIMEEPDVSIVSAILLQAQKDNVLISIDPNIREKSIHDKEGYRKHVKETMKIADILKLSDDDLSFLYPNVSAEQALKQLYTDNKNTSLIALTAGRKPIKIKTLNNYLEIPVTTQTISGDTIGAGDCFVAGLLYECKNSDLWGRAAVENISTTTLQRIINTAEQVAGYNCQHFGCNPPYKKDLTLEN